MVDFSKLINKPVVGTIKKEEEKEDVLESISFSDSDFDFADDINIENVGAVIPPNRTPKAELINFIKTSQFDVEYYFNHNGTYDSAKAYIQRMRVELSRFRAQIIKLNKPLNHFYVLTKGIRVESEICCTIILLKSKTRQRVEPSVIDDDVLSFLTVQD